MTSSWHRKACTTSCRRSLRSESISSLGGFRDATVCGARAFLSTLYGWDACASFLSSFASCRTFFLTPLAPLRQADVQRRAPEWGARRVPSRVSSCGHGSWRLGRSTKKDSKRRKLKRKRPWKTLWRSREQMEIGLGWLRGCLVSLPRWPGDVTFRECLEAFARSSRPFRPCRPASRPCRPCRAGEWSRGSLAPRLWREFRDQERLADVFALREAQPQLLIPATLISMSLAATASLRRLRA